ncbi:MAG: spermidine synthase [Nitriliruptoraceae bacterium]|jgi:spermidine synthase
MVMFEQLAWSQTDAGVISLTKRDEPMLGVVVYEVKLGDEYLMSSVFTVAEVALATLGLAAVEGDRALDVIVGGLGLGYTAAAAMHDPRVRDLTVVDALEDVIAWHRDGLVPDAGLDASDPRVTLHLGDFFAEVASGEGFDAHVPGRRWDAILLDVDHSPRHTLQPSHAPFYEAAGLRAMRALIADGGVFALWSDDPPDEPFMDALREVWQDVDAHVVPFGNHYTGGESTNTVYVARDR